MMIAHQQFPYQYPYPYQNTYQPQQQQTIQNGGFVVVRSEKEIETYPVAPGNMVSFKIENQPVIVEKTQGFSQFEAPRYKRWQMVEADLPPVVETQATVEPPEYALRSDIDRIDGELAAIRAQIPKKKPVKRDEEDE